MPTLKWFSGTDGAGGMALAGGMAVAGAEAGAGATAIAPTARPNAAPRWSNTAFTIAGVNSFEPSP